MHFDRHIYFKEKFQNLWIWALMSIIFPAKSYTILVNNKILESWISSDRSKTCGFISVMVLAYRNPFKNIVDYRYWGAACVFSRCQLLGRLDLNWGDTTLYDLLWALSHMVSFTCMRKVRINEKNTGILIQL